jgi:hypothetical protein
VDRARPTGSSQNFANIRSRWTCTWGGSPVSLLKKNNRYGRIAGMLETFLYFAISGRPQRRATPAA